VFRTNEVQFDNAPANTDTSDTRGPKLLPSIVKNVDIPEAAHFVVGFDPTHPDTFDTVGDAYDTYATLAA